MGGFQPSLEDANFYDAIGFGMAQRILLILLQFLK
jgi:hypothetical protein